MLTAYKSIAVLLDAWEKDEKSGEVGDYAARLASREGAHLIGLFSLAIIPVEHPADAFARGSKAVHSVVKKGQARREEATAIAGSLLERLALRHGVVSELRITDATNAEDEAALNALYYDLLIVGHPKPPGLPDRWMPEKLLYAAGVPVLIVPERLHADTLGRHVLVAWNASREARRAVADAMPFIVKAQMVTVLILDEHLLPARHGEQPGNDLAHYLARHGTKVNVVHAKSPAEGIAEGILSHAEKEDADLIVIGAYSHARAVEKLLGGVTRTMLAQVRTPLLISR